MGAILAAVLRVLGIVLGIDSIVQGIQARQATQALEVTASQTLLDTQAVELLLLNATYGLAAIQADIATLTAQLAIDVTALLTAIGAPQQAGQPVTLPPVPPAAYQPPTTAQISNATWAFPLIPTGQSANDALLQAATFALFAGQQMWLPYGYDAKFMVGGTGWWNWLNIPPDTVIWQADPAAILPADTILTWLDRETGVTPNWTIDGSGFPIWIDSFNTNWTFVLPWTQAEFEFVKNGGTIGAATGPPVWPGIGSVTLGAALVLADGLLVPGPLDGVIIEITAVPQPISYYPFGPLKSFVHVGGIAFVDDNGQSETVQPIGLSKNVVCPKSMSVADHAYIRLQNGVTGTVTPWVRA